jgi:4-amino-4-deoxy-L-arabinose transferase-like glycosyltransferase
MAEEDEKPPTLDYAMADHLRSRRLVGQAIAGAILTCGGWMLAVFFLILLAVSARSAAVSIVMGAGLLLATVIGATKATRNPARQGWGIGIWIGLGLAILIEGTCFIANMR